MADFPAFIDLSTLDGVNGFRLDGVEENDRTGASVSSAGDVNGDGIDDIIIGAYRARPGGDLDAGQSYVVFGSAGGFGASFDLATLDGTNGFRLDGVDDHDFSGKSVSSAGDINGDGIDDILIGAYGGDPGDASYTGETYVVFGSDAGFTASIDLATLDGTNGFRIDGIAGDDRAGRSVSRAGDVNGDGVDDIIIGGYGAASYAGASYVVFGNAGGFGPTLDLASLDGDNGFRLDGVNAFDLSGASVSDAGDVNGDGIDDLIIGAPGSDGYTGDSYVVFGRADFDASFALATLDGSNGFRLDGVAGDFSGFLVSSAGDVNGDGFDDVAIGAIGGGSAGASYVVFGKGAAFDPSFDLATLDGSNGFRIDGVTPGDQAGGPVSSAGDVNGDGFDDLIIGARYATAGGDSYAGQTYVVFGKAGGFDPSFDLATLDGANGFRLEGIDIFDMSGRSVSSAGDIDRDGFGDIIIGADFGDPNDDSNAGESYVIFGRKPTTAVERIGAEGDQVIRGGDLNDTLSGLGGDDALVGAGGNDSLLGGEGGDKLGGLAGDDTMSGGEGDDIYLVDNAGDALLETAGQGIDKVFTRVDFDAGANEIEAIRALGAAGLALTGGDNATRITGADGDDTLTGGAGRDTLKGNGGGDDLIASLGRDTLIGDAGADRFALDDEAGDAERPSIRDFASGEDVLVIDADDFGGGLVAGPLDPAAFRANTTGQAEDADDRLIYDIDSGQLFFDANGTDAGGRVLIARLTGAPAIDADDFLVTSAPPISPLSASAFGPTDFAGGVTRRCAQWPPAPTSGTPPRRISSPRFPDRPPCKRAGSRPIGAGASTRNGIHGRQKR